ncbi:MAG: HlyD family efflux transporter periplasmic adaptor subunit [Magnetococcales bacterium]|nr:HlyD family efflux transporter periplasmic adaptor subunit [Magnetococcales bacterium]
MSDTTPNQLATCATLMHLELEIRRAETEAELGFLMVNRTMALLPATTIIFWKSLSGSGSGRVERVSGVSEIETNSPFIQWLEQVFSAISNKDKADMAHQITAKSSREKWHEEAPAYALWSPLLTHGSNHTKNSVGGLLLLRNQPWQDGEIGIAQRLGETFAHSWMALASQTEKRKYKSWLPKGWLTPLGAILLLATFILPIQQSVLCSATVVAHEPMVITSPIDGVVQSVEVLPNSIVKKEQTLFRLVQTSYRNQKDVADTILKVAKAELLKSRQLAFSDPSIKAGLPLLQAVVEQRTVEAEHANRLLQRTVVHSQRDGVAIFADAGEWRGRPVQVGEKIMVIADPQMARLDLRMAIKDAVIMQPGAEVLFFLNTDPLNPLPAVLEHVAYNATPTADGFLAYRLLARFIDEKPPRIGLMGTGKIFGDKVSLFYYLFRRPLTALRQFIGF